MNHINRVIISGYLGKDPETDPGGPTTNIATRFTVATKEQWKDNAGEKQERTSWLLVVAWNGVGTNAATYLKKGSHVLVEGSLRTSEWNDKDSGQKRYKTEIVASNIIFLDKKPVAVEEQRSLEEPPASSRRRKTA